MTQHIVTFAADTKTAAESGSQDNPGTVAQPARPAAQPWPRESNGTSSGIRFGPFRLLLNERRLERNGETVPLGGRALDILAALVARAGEVVSKAELCEAAWPGMIVEEGNLRFHIASVRKALGERAQGGSYLITVAGRGYCFTAKLVPSERNPTVAIVRPADGARLPVALRRIIGIGRSVADFLRREVGRCFADGHCHAWSSQREYGSRRHAIAPVRAEPRRPAWLVSSIARIARITAPASSLAQQS
jgi:DNA-binding winged helix-turn-helix (wHTH) protein